MGTDETRRRSLATFHDLQLSVSGVHPLLRGNYILGIAEGNDLALYERTPSGYASLRTIVLPMSVPPGTMAAFPVPGIGDAAAVTTDDGLATLEGMILILHEFAHCYQMRECEQQLRAQLPLFAAEHPDPMWEIDYPFDYANAEVVKLVQMVGGGAGPESTLERISSAVVTLSDEDAQYMVWQLWKEGFARFLENRIRAALGRPQNSGGSDPESVCRESLYVLGDAAWREMTERAGREVSLQVGFERLLGLRGA